MSLCVIAPRLPPAIDGVGDYCRQLWLQLHDRQPFLAQPWQFLVLDGAEATSKAWDGVRINQFAPTQEDVIEKLDQARPEVILLQYVGYGYAVNGAPTWLTAALEKWKRQNHSIALVVMFHETWPNVRPWQRTFWRIGSQKHCICQILDVATTVVTSVQANADSLRTLRPEKPVQIIPIGSSFPVHTGDESKDWKSLVIFGKEKTRMHALRVHEKAIRKLDSSQAINTIILAGERMQQTDPCKALLEAMRLSAKITGAYNFPNDAVPDIVSSCGLALIYSQTTYLLKSTAFHLAASLGQVSLTKREHRADPIVQDGVHFLSYDERNIGELVEQLADTASLKKISTNCRALSRDELSWNRLGKLWSTVLRIAPI